MNVGIIGIGLMGRALVERFVEKGYALRIFNRSREHLKDLDFDAISVCDRVEDLVNQCDTMILMLSDADAISQLILQTPVLEKLQGKTILQMATISPAQSRHIEEILSSVDAKYLEAPVLGSLPEVKSGSLIIMAAGQQAVYEQTLPVLKVVGREPRYIGEMGSAAALKLAMNQLIAALTAGFSLSLGYALKNGVGADVFMDIVRESALYAKTYDKKLDKYLNADFAGANFSTRHLLKDIRLFIEDAEQAGLATDALAGIEKITSEAVEQGMALMDYSSIYQVICPDNSR